jgi:hypothetical protein
MSARLLLSKSFGAKVENNLPERPATKAGRTKEKARLFNTAAYLAVHQSLKRSGHWQGSAGRLKSACRKALLAGAPSIRSPTVVQNRVLIRRI